MKKYKRFMKNFLLFLLFSGLITPTFIQPQTANISGYQNIKKIRGEDENVKVDVRKPDNAAIMKRTSTKEKFDIKINVFEKLKKSNKLLY
ncbi:MAG: hypothetical protein H8E33_01860 [Candidatus Cloacimonetes bacterium]|nr:hypothetical protein [Candidatus Cloacimonadota bacterium]